MHFSLAPYCFRIDCKPTIMGMHVSWTSFFGAWVLNHTTHNEKESKVSLYDSLSFLPGILLSSDFKYCVCTNKSNSRTLKMVNIVQIGIMESFDVFRIYVYLIDWYLNTKHIINLQSCTRYASDVYLLPMLIFACVAKNLSK